MDMMTPQTATKTATIHALGSALEVKNGVTNIPIELLRRAAREPDADERIKAIGYPVHYRTPAELQRMAAGFAQHMEKLADGWYFMWPRDHDGLVYKESSRAA